MPRDVYAATAGAAPELTDGARKALREQQQLQQAGADATTMAAADAAYNYVLDVPVSELEVDVLRRTLHAVEPPPPPPPTASDDAEGRTVAGAAAAAARALGFLSVDAALAMENSGGRPSHPLAPFPAFDPAAVKNLPMTKVLAARREWLPHKQQFPIYQSRTALFDAVLSNSVVMVVGGRGSGKTLQVPSVLAESDSMKRLRVVVVSANEAAATLTAHRLREERGELKAAAAAAAAASGSSNSTHNNHSTNSSSSVGLVLPHLCAATPGSTTVVTTAEVLLRQLVADPALAGCGCVIFDDAHLRTEATEMCFAALKLLLAHAAAATAAVAAEDAAAAKKRRRLRVVVNCLDEGVSAPIADFFAAPRVPALSSGLVASSAGLPFGTGGGTGQVQQSPHQRSRTLSSPDAYACKVGVFNVAQASTVTSAAAPAVLYVDETIQWLRQCATEGPRLCRDPKSDLHAYVDNVDVMSRTMAANDNAFTDEAGKGMDYWVAVLRQAVTYYDHADRAARQQQQQLQQLKEKGPLPAIVVVVPNSHHVNAVGTRLCAALRGLAAAAAKDGEDAAAGTASNRKDHNAEETIAVGKDDEAANGVSFVSQAARGSGVVRIGGFALVPLSAGTPSDLLLRVAQRRLLSGGGGKDSDSDDARRLVYVATTELAQTVLPFSHEVGLVVDFAMQSSKFFDAVAARDRWRTDFSPTQALRHRQYLARLPLPDANSGGNSAAASPPMVLQLITRSVLHSTAHRHLSTDPTQHAVFHLSLARQADLYRVFKAWEEVYGADDQARLDAAAAVAAGGSRGGGGAYGYGYGSGNNESDEGVLARVAEAEAASAMVSKMHLLLSGALVGVPAAAAARYEHVKSAMLSVEARLIASGEVDVVEEDDDDETEGGVGVWRSRRLTPLGWLSTIVPLPTPVTRLLLFAPLFDAAVEATAVAASWLVGDVFALPLLLSRDRDGAGSGEIEARRREHAELRDEAVDFFSQQTPSDAAAVLGVYRMWLTMRAQGAEDEAQFLETCPVPLSTLEAVLRLQAQLLHTMCHLRFASADVARLPASATATEAEAAVAAAVVALPEEAAVSVRLRGCLTAALYPSAATARGSGGVALLLDGLHNLISPTTHATLKLSRRYAAFAAGSAVLARPLAELDNRPFVFLSKDAAGGSAAAAVDGDGGSASGDGRATVLTHGVPAFEPAAIVHCGEAHQRPQVQPVRCRGFHSVLTGAWRETRAARHLPPPAQLLPVAVRLQPYDTIRHRPVMVHTDYNWQCTLRSTTLGWLQAVRAHTRKYIAAVARGAAAATATATANGGSVSSPENEEQGSVWDATSSSREVARAWQWWTRRQEGARAWLREEREIARHSAKAASENENEEEPEGSTGAEQSQPPRLYPYFEFRTEAGLPRSVAVPSADQLLHHQQQQQQQQREAAAAAAAAAAEGEYNGESAVIDGDEVLITTAPVPDASAAPATTNAVGGGVYSIDDETVNIDAVDGTGAGGADAVFRGKRPPELVEETMRTCVTAIAQEHSREMEAALLRDDPEAFCFLDPENDYHEYYLFLLQRAAPDIGILGHNIDELTAFLHKLEVEVRVASGLPAEEQPKQQQQHQQQQQQQQQQLQQGVDSYGNPISYYGGGGDGAAGGDDVYQVQVLPTGGASAAADGSHQLEGAGGGEDGGGILGDGTGVELDTNTITLTRDTFNAEEPQINNDSSNNNNNNNSGNYGETLKGATTKDAAAAATASQAPAPSSSTITYIAPPTREPIHIPLRTEAQAASDANENPDAPTAAELMALLGAGGPLGLDPAETTAAAAPDQANPATSVAAAEAGDGDATAMSQQQLMEALFPPPPPGGPLSRPPPPIPAAHVEQRVASVVVYPLPTRFFQRPDRKHQQTPSYLAFSLARALGERLGMRVGPTRIVGRVARVQLPNPNVEARVLQEIDSFSCLGEKVYVFRNDRIIDNPALAGHGRGPGHAAGGGAWNGRGGDGGEALAGVAAGAGTAGGGERVSVVVHAYPRPPSAATAATVAGLNVAPATSFYAGASSIKYPQPPGAHHHSHHPHNSSTHTAGGADGYGDAAEEEDPETAEYQRYVNEEDENDDDPSALNYLQHAATHNSSYLASTRVDASVDSKPTVAPTSRYGGAAAALGSKRTRGGGEGSDIGVMGGAGRKPAHDIGVRSSDDDDDYSSSSMSSTSSSNSSNSARSNRESGAN